MNTRKGRKNNKLKSDHWGAELAMLREHNSSFCLGSIQHFLNVNISTFWAVDKKCAPQRWMTDVESALKAKVSYSKKHNIQMALLKKYFFIQPILHDGNLNLTVDCF